MKLLIFCVIAFILVTLTAWVMTQKYAFEVKNEFRTIEAYVTGFNSGDERQNDSEPCISASGDNICGREGVLACPREYPLGTKFAIGGVEYICLDRMHKRFTDRFDLNCNLDKDCPYKVTGIKTIILLDLNI